MFRFRYSSEIRKAHQLQHNINETCFLKMEKINGGGAIDFCLPKTICSPSIASLSIDDTPIDLMNFSKTSYQRPPWQKTNSDSKKFVNIEN